MSNYIPQATAKTLKPSDITQIVDTFAALDSIPAIETYARELYDYMQSTGAAATTVSVNISHINNELKKLKPSSKLMADYSGKGVNYSNHAGITALLNLDKSSREAVEAAKKERKTSNRNIVTGKQVRKQSRPVSLGFALGRAIELLKSDRPWEAACGVALVTGRRMVEVLYSMKFQADDSHTMIISTPAKKKNEKNTRYRIPVLAPSDLIEQAIETVRTGVDMQFLRQIEAEEGLDIAKKAINKKYASTVRNAFIDRLKPALEGLEDPESERRKEAVFHSTRNAYGLILVHCYAAFHNESLANAIEFAQAALVHSSTGTTIKYLKQTVDNIPVFPDELNRQILNPAIIGQVETSEDATLITLDLESFLNSLDDTASLAVKEALKDTDMGDYHALGVKLAQAFSNTKTLVAIADQTPSTEGYTQAVVDAIIAYNKTTTIRPDYRPIYITASMISKVSRFVRGKEVDRSVAKRVLTMLNDKLTAHHNEYNINEKSNYYLRGWDAFEEVLATELPLHYVDPYSTKAA